MGLAKPASGRDGKVRYAVVGLGWISQSAMLPGFAGASANSTLAALVSDDPEKSGPLSRRYAVDRRYSYDQYGDCLSSGEVDAVYLGVPNHLHRSYAERAARAGVHVLCEKPIASTEEDGRAMIRACEEAGVRLMVAYRLHLHPAHLEGIEAARSGKLGDPRAFTSLFVEPIPEGDVRLNEGGGPLEYIGLYCVNAARHLFGAEPLEAFAVEAGRGSGRFARVEETCSGVLTFPDGRVASFTCGFNSPYRSELRLTGTEGDLRIERAFAMKGPMTSTLTVGGRADRRDYPAVDQFAAELAYFSGCILEGRAPQPSGLEGLADVRIAQGLRRSASEGRSVRLEPIEPPARPDPARGLALSPSDEPELIKVRLPFRQTD